MSYSPGAPVPSSVITSTTPLAGAATYTSSAELSPRSMVLVQAFSDVAGTLYLDFSIDGTNWDSVFPVGGIESVSTGSGYLAVFPAAVGGRYIRVRYTNGSSAQSSFRLQAFYSDFTNFYSPIDSNIGQQAPAIIVRSVSTELDLALGRFTGMSEDAKFGRVEGIDNTGDFPCDIWAMADDGFASRLAEKTFPSSAATLYMASDASGDTDIEVTVPYLNSSGVPLAVTSNLNSSDATTPVNLGVTALDCNRAFLSGDNETASGNIFISNNSSFTSGAPSTLSNTLAMIPAGYGQTQQAIDQTPAGYKYRIKRLIAYMARANGAAGSATIELQVKPSGGSWLVKREFFITTSQPVNKPVAGIVLDGLTQVRLKVTDVSDNDSNFFGEWHYDLVAT